MLSLVLGYGFLGCAVLGCSDTSTCEDCGPTAAVEGDVLAFLTEVPGPRIVGAKVTVLEHPEMSVVTGDDAHFRFDGLPVGSDVTLLVEHPDLKTTQTATLTLDTQGVMPFAIQVVPAALFDALSTLVPLPVEESEHCVIASTVARFGGSLFVHLRQGMADVAVSLSPAVAAESGPIYFDESVLPAPMQPTTSIDGGVLFYRVPPGDYVLHATHPDHVFNEVRLQCRAGIVVNAGPPLGLLADVVEPSYGAGAAYVDDANTTASDALCAATAACVNEQANANDYPESTLASCQAQFRNTWAWVDDDCAASSGVREAARAVYGCRAESCTVTLGGDDVCADEEAAFRSAETTYGRCLRAAP